MLTYYEVLKTFFEKNLLLSKSIIIIKCSYSKKLFYILLFLIFYFLFNFDNILFL